MPVATTLFLPAASGSGDPCDPGAQVCDQVMDLTRSADLSRAADVLIGKPLAVTLLVVGGLLVRWVLHRLVERLFRKIGAANLPERRGAQTDQLRQSRRLQRAKAMSSLFHSIITGIVFAVVGTMVLAEFDVNIAPIVASAGIVGVALGFGAQSLVKDWLAGVAMIFEDQYGVGDVVDLGNVTGTVEGVSLRVTRLRDMDGTVWYVRNGEITKVGNQSQNWARAVLDVTVDAGADVAEVKQVLRRVAGELWEDPDWKGVVIEEPHVWGIEAIEPDVTVRLTLKTAPMEQWRVAREMRLRIREAFASSDVAVRIG